MAEQADSATVWNWPGHGQCPEKADSGRQNVKCNSQLRAQSGPIAMRLHDSFAANAADGRRRLTGNPFDFQPTVVQDRRFRRQSGHCEPYLQRQ